MCGIVGAIAQRDVAQILLEGLKRLEYRGYDSAGMAIIQPSNQHIQRIRAKGKVQRLADMLHANLLKGHTGIAHTRWATHGEPSAANAHPHFSSDELAIVHNGIIENHHTLRQELINKGYEFQSQTDSEVIAHLLHEHLQKTDDARSAIFQTSQKLKGAFALGIIFQSEPNTLYALRKGSPLIVGIGIGEHFIASDPLALLPVTHQFIYLEDNDIAKLTTDRLEIFDHTLQPVTRNINTTDTQFEQASKGQFRHFMQKEIFEQPKAINDALEGNLINHRVIGEAFGHNSRELFKQVKRVQIVACGTSYHAGLVARYWLESVAGIPTQVEVASEYRYRPCVIEPGCLFIALSQSGETADTLAALRRAKDEAYVATMAICNVPESSLVREADLSIMTRAGVEIGVAATKTFTTQLVALAMLCVALGRCHALSAEDEKYISQSLVELAPLINRSLELDPLIEKLSYRFRDTTQALFLGRGACYPIALEGALKLKEISYIHAEAYPAGELKHGPLALIDTGMPVIVSVANNDLLEKIESNIQEVQARGGDVIVFADEDITWHNSQATIIPVPSANEFIAPIIHTVALQLLSYHVAVQKGTDVDQPRNLAKSVTVE
jgi:glutamine---fructose-6-phosphate transaminase (isomerizing)